MNANKYTIIYLDGTSEVIFGEELHNGANRYFVISIIKDEKDGSWKYVTIPYSVIRKVIEE